MGNARAAGCALVLFVSLVLCASSVSGQSCTPVVYVFRHAEDTNPPEDPENNQFHPSPAHPDGTVPLFALTPTGNAHAVLYPTMINDLQAAQTPNYCRVTKVYATTTEPKANPNGDKCDPNCVSATNAFYTAQPLARAVMSGADPIITVNGEKLYEYLGNGNGSTPRTPLTYSNPIADALRGALLDTARRSESSAIFWTSQGMHVLGGVIINRGSKVPEKAGWTMPPRNAAYIFVYLGPGKDFDDTPTTDGRNTPALNASVWVQCFNHIEATNQVSSTDPNLNGKDPKFIDPAGGKQRYYCGFDYQSSVGGRPVDACAVGAKCGSICTDREPCDGKSDKDIKGKICDTRSMLKDSRGPGIFGACE